MIEEKKDSMSQVLSDIKPHMTKKFMTAHCINEQDIQSISPIFLPRYSLLDELEMRWEDEQKLNGLSPVHSIGFRPFIFT